VKLNARDAAGYFSRPDPDKMGVLIFGQDAMRVALKRQELVAALVGPQGEEEMRLTCLMASDLRKDPAALADAIKAVGFFPGPRVVFVDEATEVQAKAILPALDEWQPGDAQVVIAAGNLNARSSLRKYFEGHPNALAAAIYNDPPSRAEIEATLQKAGLADVSSDGMDALFALSRALDPGDFAQLVEKVALYKIGDSTPATSADVEACAPTSTEAEVDDLLNIVAEGRAQELGPMMRRLESQGTLPVTLCIMATRHFRTLHAAASDPGGAAQGIGRVRPPVFGPRRDRMLRQAQNWGRPRLEDGLSLLMETDMTLRSAAQTAPAMALMERALIRLAMMGRPR